MDDIQSITEDQINQLQQQGIPLDQIAKVATDQGQPVPAILQAKIDEQLSSPDTGQAAPPPVDEPVIQNAPPPSTKKSSTFPALMDMKTYNEYKHVIKEESKHKTQEHKPNVYGYTFSPLLSENIMQDMKRTQGSFLVGVNIANLFNTFRNMVVDSETNKPKKNMLKSNSDTIFKKIGEWVDVDFESILDKKMGMRSLDVPTLPEKQLTDYSTFYEILSESKKYSDRGFNGKVTPYGLLVMTRMLYKYRKSNAQWFRVATVLQLIFKYLGGNMKREQYFNSTSELSLFSLMELEEFYNTDHIFMSKKELHAFKEELEFYKYDKNIDVKGKLDKIKSKKTPL